MADSKQAAPAENPASAGQDYGKAVPVVRSFLESVLGLLGVAVEVDIDIEEDGLHSTRSGVPTSKTDLP